MYWRIRSFQELEHLSESERDRLLRDVVGWRFTLRLWIRSLVEGLLAGGLLRILLYEFLRSVLSSAYQFWLPLLMMPVCVVGVYQWHLIRIRGQLRIYLEQVARSQPLPMCLNCGYNLHGLPGPRCPECGARIDPRGKV